MNSLARLERETLDAPIGSPAVAPSAIQASWTRSLADFGSTTALGGDGTAAGDGEIAVRPFVGGSGAVHLALHVSGWFE